MDHIVKQSLIPIDGCWVRQHDRPEILGYVVDHRRLDSRIQVKVQWHQNATWVDVTDLKSGFQPGWYVQDVPVSTTRRALGPSRVVGRRVLGDREQLLVQLDATGQSVWLPYENLRRIKDAGLRYKRAETGTQDHATRFRLKLLAHALENWNHLTGSLDRLDVDPLPHQIQLVYRILSSGNYNWVIADDVGLGKTIEVGLLLSALSRKGQARRVLIVTPAGLTRQWQDELWFKFEQRYRIYGDDFSVSRLDHWKLYDHVIVSIDRAKRPEHMELFAQADGWDMVIFDEGHKLTRYASGEKVQRYRLAEALRNKSDAFLLLSGTPHQGYSDRFAALLELVRPDLKSRIRRMAYNPEIVGELILRNRKTDVTDADGNFIFKGHRVRRVPIEPSPETMAFQKLLRDYLIRGYKAGTASGMRAIGFVMTTYRKLASSSIAAIERALQNRRLRLRNEVTQSRIVRSSENLFLGGDEQDDLTDDLLTTTSRPFFELEDALIDALLAESARVRKSDEKLRVFLDEVVKLMVAEKRKLLVFTEYRGTQEYLKRALECRFPEAGEVLLINGSMNLDAKLAAITAFNEGQNYFLVSTEAGGEGLNLHRSCHVVLNYDLPWNPARLLQRIGRVYRYGQQKPVVVINLHARDSFDNAAIDLMLQRVDKMATEMAPIGSEFNDRLYADILGDVLENLDFGAVLEAATTMEVPRTQQQIDDALARAEQARRIQNEILDHAVSYDPHALEGTLGFTMQHVESFILGMLPRVDVFVERKQYDEKVYVIRLPEPLRGRFAEFGQRTVVRVTTDRRLAARLPDVELLDFESAFFQYLVEEAKSHQFDGAYASISSPTDSNGVLSAFRLRWQNDQGSALTEEFVTIFLNSGGEITVNPPFVAMWLLDKSESGPDPHENFPERAKCFSTLEEAANQRLAEECTRFKHPNGLMAIAAADFFQAQSSHLDG